LILPCYSEFRKACFVSFSLKLRSFGAYFWISIFPSSCGIYAEKVTDHDHGHGNADSCGDGFSYADDYADLNGEAPRLLYHAYDDFQCKVCDHSAHPTVFLPRQYTAIYVKDAPTKLAKFTILNFFCRFAKYAHGVLFLLQKRCDSSRSIESVPNSDHAAY